MFSYSEMFSVFGDVAYADRVERIAYNALPGAWGGPDQPPPAGRAESDMHAHQYFSCVNQVAAINTSKHLFPGRPTAESFASWHNGCCTANNGQVCFIVTTLRSLPSPCPLARCPCGPKLVCCTPTTCACRCRSTPCNRVMSGRP